MSEFIGTYGKLVRDGIPDLVRSDGDEPHVRRLNDEQFEGALYKKLVEEATEFRDSGDIAELADLLEVVRAICKLKGWRLDDIDDVRLQKFAERGGFNDRVFLEEILPKE